MAKKLQTLNNNFQFLRVTGIIMALGGILAGLVLMRQIHILNKKAVVSNASLSLPASASVNVGESVTLPVMLNTAGTLVSGVDVIITFDRNILEVESVRSRSDTNTLKSYLPQTNGLYDNRLVTEKANASGRIEFGAIAFLSGLPTGGFNGMLDSSNPFALVTFKSLRSTAGTPINFVFNGISNTTDSNMISMIDNSDILGRTQNSVLSVLTTPTPTPRYTPTPTSRPTLTVTPTQTPVNDIIKPDVSFSSPSDGTNVRINTEVRFYVIATDNTGVDKVQFFVNGNWVHVEEDDPYTYTWNVPSSPNTVYSVTARALDFAGNASSATINITSVK